MPHNSSTSKQQRTIRSRHRDAAAELIPSGVGRLHIGGEWIESAGGQTFETHDPTTGESLAVVQAGTALDIDRAVEAAWNAYNDCWAGHTVAERQAVLTTIADRVEARKEDFARLETLDNGKPITESRHDVKLVADHFRYFAGAIRVREGKAIPSDENRAIQTIREPYGVVGQIIPWNFPLLMAAWKLAPALAAGNAVVLKPAEETPLSILELMREVEDVLPAGVVNVVTGFGAEAGAPLVNHEDVKKLAFTGSTEVGRGVMKNAADSITDITLELGGKSPVIVHSDADIDHATDVAVNALFFNSGECCCAGTRLFVHEAIREEFVDALVAKTMQLSIGDPLLDDTDIGPEISQTEVARTNRYIRWARESGAYLLTSGETPAVGYFVAPTIVGDLEHERRAAQEEIFGPVGILFSWSSYEEMIELANDVDYGLAAGVITDDLSQAYRTARDLEAGNVWVNTYNEFPAGQPFGGYKQSGTGRETAFETLDEYLQSKTITIALTSPLDG